MFPLRVVLLSTAQVCRVGKLFCNLAKRICRASALSFLNTPWLLDNQYFWMTISKYLSFHMQKSYQRSNCAYSWNKHWQCHLSIMRWAQPRARGAEKRALLSTALVFKALPLHTSMQCLFEVNWGTVLVEVVSFYLHSWTISGFFLFLVVPLVLANVNTVKDKPENTDHCSCKIQTHLAGSSSAFVIHKCYFNKQN